MAKKKTETVVLIGDASNPAILHSKARIIAAGRKVEIQARPSHDTGTGLCGEHLCTCTEPCKSFHYKPQAK